MFAGPSETIIPDEGAVEGGTADGEGEDPGNGEPDDPVEEDMPYRGRVSLYVGRAEMRRRRAQCTNQLQYAARVLAKRRSCAMFDGIVFLSNP